MRNFEITSASTEDVNSKLDVMLSLRDSLNDNINLSDYTDKLDTLFIIFQCFPVESTRKVEEFKKMRRKTKTLELYLVLDYDKIMSGTDEENLVHIKEVFVKGCESFLKEMKGFYWKRFKNVLKKVI